MTMPLEGIKVLELALSLGSPYCTSMMGDFGADVIKIEPSWGDRTRNMGTAFKNGECAMFFALNRNKRGMVVDIKKDKGKEIVFKLVKNSDVVTENFRPGVLDKLGLGYDALSRVNPRVIYLSITGFGPKGPLKNKPGVELLFQALSGVMSIQGKDSEGRPLHVGAAVSDMAAGVMAFIGIMLALFERQQSGLGQKVETANLMATLSMFSIHAQNYFMEGEFSEGPMIVPHRSFPTKDGYMAISLPSNQYWPAFCKALDIEHLKDEPMFGDNMNRVKNREAFESLIEGILGQKTTDEWAKIFAEADAMGAPVHNYEEVFKDPQVLENDMLERVDHPVAGETNMVGIPIKLSRTPGRIKGPPPTLGQHTDEILQEIGYSKDEIEELRKQKVI